MSTPSEPVLRFSDVAFGIDITPKALRNWLARGQVDLVSEEREGGWRQFVLADVAVLALVRHIVPLGIRVENASRIAHTILEMMEGKDWSSRKIDPEFPDMIAFGWHNQYVVLHPVPEDEDDIAATGWSLQIRQGWQVYNRVPAAVFVTIAPEAILRRAIQRALTGDEYEPDPDTLYFTQQFADREGIQRELERTGTLPEGTLFTGGPILTDERKREAEAELAKLQNILAADKREKSE